MNNTKNKMLVDSSERKAFAELWLLLWKDPKLNQPGVATYWPRDGSRPVFKAGKSMADTLHCSAVNHGQMRYRLGCSLHQFLAAYEIALSPTRTRSEAFTLADQFETIFQEGIRQAA
jgi:hypothetical protein